MFWEWVMIIASCLVTIEAVDYNDADRLGLISLRANYSFESWRGDLRSLHLVTHRKRAYAQSTLGTLQHMSYFERTPEFKVRLRDVEFIKRTKKIRPYIKSLGAIVAETSLINKPKTVSGILYDVVLNHEGCYPGEISKINKISEILGKETRIGNVIHNLIRDTSLYCWRYYMELLEKTAKLIGKDDYDAIEALSDHIKLNLNTSDERFDVDDPTPDFIKSVSKGIGFYLKGLQHPGFNDIQWKSSKEMDSIIGEIYETEVHQIVSKFCKLLNPIWEFRLILNLTLDTWDKGQQLDLSCHLASLWSSEKLRKSIVIETSSLVTVHPLYDKKFRQFSVGDTNFETWKNDLYTLFGKHWKKNPQVAETLVKLKNMKSFENTYEFRLVLSDIKVINRSPRIKDYFILSSFISQLTTLMRKTKSVTHNLIDLISNHNGCDLSEISKIDRLATIFRDLSRMNKILNNLKFDTIRYCWKNYKYLSMKRVKLIGKANFDALVRLSQCIDVASLKNQQTIDVFSKSPPSIDSVSKGVAVYLGELQHPLLEDIDRKDGQEIESIVEQIYEQEVLYSSSRFCTLLEPIRRFLPLMSANRDPDIPVYQRLLYLSCSVASFSSVSITPRIADHLSSSGIDTSLRL